MPTRTTPAQIFPPGEFIQEELESRGWTQEELAEIMGRPRRLVNELVAGKKAITPETARDLGAAFGTGAELWMNLESVYRLSLIEADSSLVARRSKLYGLAPVKDMMRRNWIKATDNIDALEDELKQFFDAPSLDAIPEKRFTARMSATYGVKTPEQRAWVSRVRSLGKTITAAKFNRQVFCRELPNIRQLIGHEADVRRIPKVLADIGVRLVVVEQLPHSKMDGITTWLNEEAPVIGVTVRYDRIDCLWFTLFHEMIHVKYGDALSVDEDLVGEDCKPTAEKPEEEQRADREAADLLVPNEELDRFILRVRPLYYRTKITQFANRIRVHPGIIVGQLQRRGELTYAELRDTLMKVRGTLTRARLLTAGAFAP